MYTGLTHDKVSMCYMHSILILDWSQKGYPVCRFIYSLDLSFLTEHGWKSWACLWKYFFMVEKYPLVFVRIAALDNHQG